MAGNRVVGGSVCIILLVLYVYYSVWLLVLPFTEESHLIRLVFPEHGPSWTRSESNFNQTTLIHQIKPSPLYWGLALPALFLAVVFGSVGAVGSLIVIQGQLSQESTNISKLGELGHVNSSSVRQESVDPSHTADPPFSSPQRISRASSTNGSDPETPISTPAHAGNRQRSTSRQHVRNASPSKVRRSRRHHT